MKVRNNGTFNSRIFNQGGIGEADETQRSPSSTRNEEKWKSSVFDGPSTASQNRVSRKKLGAHDAGTDKLFGQDRIDYDNTANNMPSYAGIAKKPQVKNWKPVRGVKTAEQRKNEELYGASVKKFGVG